ncbi:hypothetical protein HN832_00485 [archaeon]|mgnify:CR=1 FL=1|jgi:RNase P/RNase MRP subunit p30|nr:hypothetical protein [archaeon]MBT4373719.1 hypothetical protein [archaeon]MBT4531773.1 hypothetical protein [archaeon]MBT7001885.1 hypothetical protein [archaeon]MBT7281870.1 hypothetical protein [archaeon]
MIISETTFEKTRKKVQDSPKNETIIFTSKDDDLNRKVLEKLPINILLLNQKNRKDFAKQRNSGLNQVLAKIAKKNKIQIGINFDELKEKNPKIKSQIIARVKQNIKLCNKNKIQMKFISKGKIKKSHDIKSLGLILSMPTWMTKEL